MAVYVTHVYPKLAFYTPSREEPWYFDHGVFDVEDRATTDVDRKELTTVLDNMVVNPGFTGVMKLEDKDLPFGCEFCQKRFQSQAALNGHLGGATHKTQEQINEEANREGAVPLGNVMV